MSLSSDVWILRHAPALKVTFRIVFGIFWLIDGTFKFQPGFVNSFSGMIAGAAGGQPSWLAGWFSFWSSATSSNPALFVYSTGALEIAIGLCLIAGLLQKMAVTGSLLLGLLIWSVPEGFGGPYGPGSTDIGTGVVYALASVLFLIIMAAFGPSRLSLDFAIERKWPPWKKLAEIQSS